MDSIFIEKKLLSKNRSFGYLPRKRLAKNREILDK